MIYTVTLNPAVDYVFCADEIRSGEINRAMEEAVSFGGKGINVSMVLKELGIRSEAMGFIAGFTGDAIERSLADGGIAADFVRLEQGFSRINIKIRTSVETELNGRGPEIPPGKLEELYRRMEKLREGDTVVLAGSIPSSLPEDIYEKLLERLSGRGVRAVADITGKALLNVLKYRPFLVKPNHRELGELFGAEADSTEKVIAYAGRLKEMGAVNVLVSRAGEGAALLDEGGGVHVCGACRGSVVNSVGAGDSMVAGFLAGCRGPEKGCGERAVGVPDYEYALRLGTAAGGATAFSRGLAKRDEIFRLLEDMRSISDERHHVKVRE